MIIKKNRVGNVWILKTKTDEANALFESLLSWSKGGWW